MNNYKKIIIIIIILLFICIVWQFNKYQLPRLIDNDTHIESFNLFGLPSQSSELDTLKSTDKTSIKNVTKIYGNLPLREYCIKGSYNTAFTGHYINLDMIEYVLSRGCRFLDFEIYYIKEKDIFMPKVGFSTDGTFTILESENSILLDNVLAAVVANAFSDKSPNNKDPLFINLRIKSNNPDVYKAVAKSIDYSILSKLFVGKVTNDTPLNKLMDSIVIIIDKTINRDYLQLSKCKKNDKTCYDLKNYTNMESGSETLNLVTYTYVTNQLYLPITVADDNISTDIKKMRLALPDAIPKTKENPDVVNFITKAGCQITPNRFYYNDKYLEKYEKLFNDNTSAFVPLAVALPYYHKLKTI